MKRFFDFIISLILLIMFLPLFLLLCFVIKLKLGSPVIFCQVRPGLNEKLFKMYKFRTMLDLYNDKGEPLPDEMRLTSFGKFLRSTSLDELPGLWNVLIGNMSLVGPRPLLVEYLELYNNEQKIRHNVRPGITGWAQVNGRNAISWEEKFRLDIFYVKNWSLLLDLKILLLTVKKVLLRSDISSKGTETAHKFNGHN